MERRVLLKTLAGQLPSDVVRFSSKLAKIQTSSNGETLLELVDGSKLLAKVSSRGLTSLISLVFF